MSDNPFEPPKSESSSHEHERSTSKGEYSIEGQLTTAAICLLIASAVSLLVLVLGVVSNALWLNHDAIWSEVDVEIAESQKAGLFTAIGLSVVLGTLNLVTIVGSINMLQRMNYRFCVAASLIACLPCCASCYILGMPFGIWALVVLQKEEIKTLFREKELALDAAHQSDEGANHD